MKLNKIKDILSSVKAKLFMTLSSTILLIILFLIVVNNFALEKFYLYKKQNTLKTVYESINNYYKTPGQDNDIQTELEKLSIKNNFDILIKDNNGINLYTTNKNFSTVIGSINDILDRINTSGGKELESNDNYTIKKQRDIKNGLTYMMLSGKMENGYFLYIRIPLNSIQDSVSISNNFLLMMAGFTILIASIINIFIGGAMISLVISIIGVVIFSGYVLYDISLIKHEIQNGEIREKNELSIHVLNLYLDFINILLDLLNIASILDD